MIKFTKEEKLVIVNLVDRFEKRHPETKTKSYKKLDDVLISIKKKAKQAR